MKYILKIDTNDSKGLVYKISKVLYENDINIDTNSEFVDTKNNKFFFRVTFIKATLDKSRLINIIKKNLEQEIQITINENKPKNIVVFVTKESHTLGDLLIRNYSKKINANIKAVISNHNDLRELVQKFDIPYHFVDATNESRETHEHKILDILKKYNYEYIVLAKYMRILSDTFVSNIDDNIINIHHSFLPAFIGANPYLQAYQRGVKTIGATSHFVTSNLDEGPIIYQETTKVGHEFSASDMKKEGAKIETLVLSKALDLVFEDKVFIHNNRTIIL